MWLKWAQYNNFVCAQQRFNSNNDDDNNKIGEQQPQQSGGIQKWKQSIDLGWQSCVLDAYGCNLSDVLIFMSFVSIFRVRYLSEQITLTGRENLFAEIPYFTADAIAAFVATIVYIAYFHHCKWHKWPHIVSKCERVSDRRQFMRRCEASVWLLLYIWNINHSSQTTTQKCYLPLPACLTVRGETSVHYVD